MEYNTLTSVERDEFATEAKQRIAEISNDSTAYTELTDVTPVPEFKRRKRNSNKEKGDN
jgi:hypothetical protein